MKRKKIIIVILIAVAAVVGLIIWWGTNQDSMSANLQVISGRVTSINNGCFADGGCSVTLDDSKVIVTGCGLMANGKTCKSYDQSKLHSGQKVEATVVMDRSGMYSLECDSCTIRVIE